MYGGGGNTGAPYTNDFLELYNPTSSAISLSGLSIQYASATSASWNSVALPSASVAAGHYYLIQAAAGTTVTNSPLPVTADFVITGTGSTGSQLNFPATAGKVAIVNGTAALTAVCPSRGAATGAYVDLIGFGTATCFEGNAAAAAPSNSTADVRNNVNVDAIDNSLDFAVGSPNPHNSGSLTVPVTPPTVNIHTIQGSKSTTGMTISPYAGQQVTTTGVVTTVLPNGFFIQNSDNLADTDPTTPEGIDIFTSSRPTVVVGNVVTVTGKVQTFPAVTASHTPATEITGPTVTVTSPGSPTALPTPVALTSAMLTPSGGLYQFTPYEGMRVTIASVSSVSGTTGSITAANEANEVATSNGYFYGVITGTPRPFREPGIDIRDVAITGAPTGTAKFDDNPERILIDTILSGGTSIEISTGAVLPNVSGVLDFTFSADSFYDPSRLILDAGYPRSSVVAGMTPTPVAPAASNEFTVASYNIERFYNPAQTTPDDLYFVPAGVQGFNGSPGTGITSTGQTFISAAVDVTPAAYATRLKKLSLAIRTILNTPDVVTLEEVENQTVASDIAAQINADAGVSNLYTAYSTDNSTFFTQDGTGISVGFLVKNTVNKLGLTQFGAGKTFTPTTSTNPISQNDRPWLVLNAGVKRANSKDYPVTVIVNHMKALTGVNSATSTSTRQKKEFQAEDIAAYIQGLQTAGQHVISGGDFNAFEFSDGYTDTLATCTNTNVLPTTQVVQPGVAGLVSPPLANLALTLPANQRWSYQEGGSAQILDQMVVTPELLAGGAHFAYAHLNADFPATLYNDATTPARSSDHDVAVGYFVLPAPVLAGTVAPAPLTFPGTTLGISSAGLVVTFSNTGEGPVNVTSVTATGDFAVSNNCSTVAINSSCSANVVFLPTVLGTRTGTITFATNVLGATFTVAATGTGIAPPPPTFTPATLTFATTGIGFSAAAQTITLTNPATTAATIGSITATGDFSQTNTCPTSLAAKATCTVSVVFKPTAAGARTGTLTVVTTGFSAGTLTGSLTGTGIVPDFSLGDSTGSSSTTLSVIVGNANQIMLTFTPQNGFSGTVALTCAAVGTAPLGVTCTVPAAFPVSGGPVMQAITYRTTSRHVITGVSSASFFTGLDSTGILFGLSVLAMLLAARIRGLKRYTRLCGLLAAAFAVCLAASGCGSGVNPNATPAGTYTYAVTATSGTSSHTETITLIVQ